MLKSHRRPTILLFALSLVFGFWIIWAIISTILNESYINSVNLRANEKLEVIVKSDPGVIYDIEVAKDEFEIEGFKYFAKLPFPVKALRHYMRLWILRRGFDEGRITLRDVQKHTRQNGQSISSRKKPLLDVTVWIRYYLSDPDDFNSKLSVLGTYEGSESQISEEMEQRGESYCRKIVFLGPVKTVTIEAEILDPKYYVIIDELKISVGPAGDEWDSLPEYECL